MAAPSKQSIVYKTVGRLEVSLDIHLPPNAKNLPVLVWFHGGGLLQGHHQKVAPHMLASVSKYNHALVSADYRLAPQVGVEDIYEDVRDCIDFVRSPNGLVKHLEGLIDPSRLAVSGSSAGGYLAFLAGLYVEPKPQAIIPIYPITDPLGTFFTTWQPGGHGDPNQKVTDATVAPFTDRAAAVVANNEPDTSRNKMYTYMLDRANLAELLHFNVKTDPQHDLGNDKWRIAKQVAARGLPPTYVVHGTADLDVGVEQADEVVGVMVGERMEVKYERLKGKDHLFDAKDPNVKLEAMYEFMHKHV